MIKVSKNGWRKNVEKTCKQNRTSSSFNWIVSASTGRVVGYCYLSNKSVALIEIFPGKPETSHLLWFQFSLWTWEIQILFERKISITPWLPQDVLIHFWMVMTLYILYTYTSHFTVAGERKANLEIHQSISILIQMVYLCVLVTSLDINKSQCFFSGGRSDSQDGQDQGKFPATPQKKHPQPPML